MMITEYHVEKRYGEDDWESLTECASFNGAGRTFERRCLDYPNESLRVVEVRYERKSVRVLEERLVRQGAS